MKRILKRLCAVVSVMGLFLGTTTISQAEWNGMNYRNECNSVDDIPEKGAVLVDDSTNRAPDGTAYIRAHEKDLLHDNKKDALDIAFEMKFSASAIESFSTWEMDIMFTAEESGFSIRNNSGANQGSVNTTIKYGSGALRYSGATGDKICDAEMNKWYHIKLTGVYGNGQDNAIMNISIYKYDDNNVLKLVGEVAYPGGKYGNVLRNDKAPTRFAFAPGTCVDNVTAYEIAPKAVMLNANKETNADGGIDIKAGESISFSYNLYADSEKSMEMSGFDVVYELWNTTGDEQLISDEISITPEAGVLTLSGAAQTQSFIVRAKCVDFLDVYDDIVVDVESVPIIQFIGAGFDAIENPTKIVNLKFNQNYENEGDISFVVAVYDENKLLVDVHSKALAYKEQKTGELVITLNEQLPVEFDKDTWTIKVFVWSKTL